MLLLYFFPQGKYISSAGRQSSPRPLRRPLLQTLHVANQRVLLNTHFICTALLQNHR
uniref:Uncharacterized protein n=1 Tax=Arundo donax TaxID=35708 RepID=A0A0A9F3M7_ARUDO